MLDSSVGAAACGLVEFSCQRLSPTARQIPPGASPGKHNASFTFRITFRFVSQVKSVLDNLSHSVTPCG